MKKLIALLVMIAMIAGTHSCRKTPNQPSGTVYLDLPASAYQYNTTKNTDKSINPKATLGRVLFYDNHLSVNNAVSCGSCHKQAAGFADNSAFSVGFEGRLTGRNSKSIVNITGDSLMFNVSQKGLPLFWDGREDVLQNLVARPVTNHVEMGIDDYSVLPAKLTQLGYYAALFTNAYGDSTITVGRLSECVAIFVASIQSHSTRFDQFMGAVGRSSNPTPQHPEVFSAEEYAGYNLFLNKYQCQNCHHIFSSTYSTADFRDIGLDENYTDLGMGTISGYSSENGKFRVPNLRNVALSAPYMHDGRFKTLDEVIDHYSTGIKNSPNLDWDLREVATGKARMMNISDDDKKALVAFLNTFTDYALVTDPKFSNPFKVK